MFLTKLHYRYVRTLWTLRFLAIKKQFKPDEKFIPLKKIIRIWARKVGAYKISRRIDAISRRRSGKTSNYVGATILPTYMSRERFPREVFEKSVYTKFEDTELSIPEGYDIYLTSLFGNYMVRPDVSERATHHHMKVYINE
jgi:lipopolysaccharide cholinephosphotransferase